MIGWAIASRTLGGTGVGPGAISWYFFIRGSPLRQWCAGVIRALSYSSRRRAPEATERYDFAHAFQDRSHDVPDELPPDLLRDAGGRLRRGPAAARAGRPGQSGQPRLPLHPRPRRRRDSPQRAQVDTAPRARRQARRGPLAARLLGRRAPPHPLPPPRAPGPGGRGLGGL